MIVGAFVAGILAGAVHLTVVALRAALVGRGRLGPSLLLAPLGLVAPLGAVYACAGSASTLFAVVAGLVVARFLFVQPIGRALEEAAWTR